MSAPILIGLNADMSASSAIGGEAIRRGAIIAIDEINRAGGVLGRPFTLTVRDHRGNPDRGIDNINDLASNEDLVAVIGGVHTPVAMAELETVHEHGIVYLGPWAAGALVVDHSYEPNFVFRVSVRDAYAGEFLIDAALERGYRHPAFLLWQTTWGRSNEVAMRTALESRGKQPAAIEWFNTGAKSVTKQLEAIKRAGADVVMLIAEPNGAATAVRDMAVLAPEERLAIIADWGLTAGEFHRDVRDDLSAVDLKFLQTFTFFDPPFPDRANRVLAAYCNHFGDCDGPVSVRAPTGFAHAYDLVYLLARAIEAAGTVERSQVRQALERLKRHAGLVRLYQPPFTPTDHDALAPDDYRLAAYDENGVIVPLDF
ncbi:MAG: ABC transporter substrate-binding protein [Alphaproteobacteria bacterium]|nr:ABC transporter substrate-binding protein [Alphaproteobacteria bacterium]